MSDVCWMSGAGVTIEMLYIKSALIKSPQNKDQLLQRNAKHQLSLLTLPLLLPAALPGALPTITLRSRGGFGGRGEKGRMRRKRGEGQ